MSTRIGCSNILSQENSPLERFGLTGMITLLKIESLLTYSSLHLTYDRKTRTFAIANGHRFSKHYFECLFAKQEYSIWKPEVSDGFDRKGNRIIYLLPAFEGAPLRSRL